MHARDFNNIIVYDFIGAQGQFQVILKKIQLPIVPFDECQNALRTTRLGKFFILHESFICAGGKEGKDTCTVSNYIYLIILITTINQLNVFFAL